jgi:DNA-binding transcriptional MerR regulator
MKAAGYDIEALARHTGSTTRTLRAYQTAGLLPPPDRDGRRARYTEAHVRRLAVIERLRARHWSLAAIAEVLAAWEDGRTLGELLGPARAPAPSPTTWLDDLFELADRGVDPHVLAPSLN